MEKGEEYTSARRPLFFVENSNYMDTPTPGDDEVVIDNHGIVLGNDDDDVVVLEPTLGNDNDGISEPTSGNDVDGVSEPMSGNNDDGVSCPTLGNDDGDGGVSKPTPRMFFKTEKELIYYYKQYGRQAGFGIMTQRSKRENDGSVRYVTLGCARGGKARKRITNISKPCPITKTDCKARINAVLADDVLRITTICNAHNHGLSPQKARFFRCNRAIDDSVKRQLDINDKAGKGMSKSFNALVVEASGFEKLPFIEKDARNYIDKARHLRLGKGGVDALRGYFERMQYKNDGFYSSMDLDDDGQLKNVFWIDARSRAAYEYFGDVVTFDTAY
ncbi:protein FAR1-RELATED SEQUENCE 5-like [Carya illinoinensis]|uniref:protein FAR1-RELATED SEQUENCE 5-like n=1 Tax=Carya illinoinensis TaxID=32201 RepID=UPI001C718904|nr:protein FAR1-RELATED SEQUENCE 5-like [Carya illinoinensis]